MRSDDAAIEYDEAVEVPWKELRAELERFARSRLGDPELVEDVLQTAFLRAHTHLLAGEHPTHPRAWLYQIVKNLMVDAARQTSRRRALAEAMAKEPEPEPEPLPASQPEIFELIARSLPLFIEELPVPYRRALELTELQGLTHAEAARLEGVSLTALKSRARRGRQKVFAALQDCCRFEVDARGRVLDYQPRKPRQTESLHAATDGSDDGGPSRSR